MKKPKLYKTNGFWVCQCEHRTGIALEPMEAYRLWYRS